MIQTIPAPNFIVKPIDEIKGFRRVFIPAWAFLMIHRLEPGELYGLRLIREIDLADRTLIDMAIIIVVDQIIVFNASGANPDLAHVPTAPFRDNAAELRASGKLLPVSHAGFPATAACKLARKGGRAMPYSVTMPLI
jgi:hypothetical protein